MKIKESEQLKRLATASGQTPNKVSETIVTELINKGIIEDIATIGVVLLSIVTNGTLQLNKWRVLSGQLVFPPFVPFIWTTCWSAY